MFPKYVLSYIAMLHWCTDCHQGELKKNSYELFREFNNLATRSSRQLESC